MDDTPADAPDWTALGALPAVLAEKVSRVRSQVRGSRLAVAYSGGVDSAVLLALAVAELGEDALAVLGVSPSLAPVEHAAALRVASQLGVRVHELPTHEGERAEYRANGPDRCYFCKDELFTRMDEVAGALGVDALAYGENADDAQRSDRPGSKAAREHRVLHPLADAGMTKTEVREVARAIGLACADKPAAPCLASRIPHFSEVLPAKLAAVAHAEQVVRDAGFSDCRVRHHGEMARIELPVDELSRVLDADVRQALLDGVRACGFRTVVVDLDGIRSGAFTLQVLQGQSRG